MPNRGIKESILTSQTIDRLSPLAERFFYRLLLVCDDYGRTDADPRVLRSRCFPLQIDRVSNEDVAGWLEELESVGLILTYHHADRSYLQFINWDKHQRKGRRAKRSKYPAPPPEVLHASAEQLCADEEVPVGSAEPAGMSEDLRAGSADPVASSADFRGDPPVTSETSETSETEYTPPETPPTGGSVPVDLDTLVQAITGRVQHQETPALVRRYFARNRLSRYRTKRQVSELVQKCAACFDEALDDFTLDELAAAIDAAPPRRWWWQIVNDLRQARNKVPPPRASPPVKLRIFRPKDPDQEASAA